MIVDDKEGSSHIRILAPPTHSRIGAIPRALRPTSRERNRLSPWVNFWATGPPQKAQTLAKRSASKAAHASERQRTANGCKRFRLNRTQEVAGSSPASSAESGSNLAPRVARTGANFVPIL